MNNITSYGYTNAIWIVNFNTVQSYSDILDTNILIIIINTDVCTLFIIKKVIQNYISELTSTVFCKDDELYALSILLRARVFPYGVINKLPRIYHQHLSQPTKYSILEI